MIELNPAVAVMDDEDLLVSTRKLVRKSSDLLDAQQAVFQRAEQRAPAIGAEVEGEEPAHSLPA